MWPIALTAQEVSRLQDLLLNLTTEIVAEFGDFSELQNKLYRSLEGVDLNANPVLFTTT